MSLLVADAIVIALPVAEASGDGFALAAPVAGIEVVQEFAGLPPCASNALRATARVGLPTQLSSFSAKRFSTISAIPIAARVVNAAALLVPVSRPRLSLATPETSGMAVSWPVNRR